MIEPKLKKKNLINRIIKKQLFITLSTAFLLVFILVGSSYAILNGKTETGVTDVIVQSGNLTASISSEEGEIIEMNYTTLGVSNEVGLTYDPYTFSVENTGQTTIAYYELRIVDKEYELSNLPHKSINYALSKDGGDYTEPQNLGDNKSYIYVGGPIAPGESDDFNLKMWVNEEFGKYANNKNLKAAIELTLYSDVPTRNYIIYDTQGGSYIPKTNVSSKRVTNQVPLKEGYSFVGWSVSPNGNVFYEQNGKYDSNNGTTLYAKYEEAIITYNLNGGTGDVPSNKANQGITNLIPIKDGFKFLGWSTNQNATNAEYHSGDKYNGSSITLYAVWHPIEYLYNKLETTLISNLHEPDSDGTRYVYGSEVDNNYVWFSGKLWRVVSLNNDRTVKLVTQGNMTTIGWSTANNLDYSSSQIRKWVNEVFLPTINENLIVTSSWDYSAYTSFPTSKLSTVSINTDKVGSLNIYDYMMSGGTDNVDTSNTFLNSGYSFWLSSPNKIISVEDPAIMETVSVPYIWYIDSSGKGISGDGRIVEYGMPQSKNLGVRPSVNLKSNLIISKGNGTVDNPYILDDDVIEVISGQYLNNRISGEYVKFNNIKYRIVGIEKINNQNYTKVTMADYNVNNNSIGMTQFNDQNDISFSVSSGIGLYLQNWYNGINNIDKRMIATNADGVLWYQNVISGDYTHAKLGDGISATIGLPYYGEMFSSQFAYKNEDSVEFWLITPVYSFWVEVSLGIFPSGSTDAIAPNTIGVAVRPSFYLKSNVKITGGTGLPNDPYEIAMD